MPNLIPVAFQGDTIDTAQEGERVWISVRRVSDSLGLDYPTQHTKLSQKSWATVGLCPMVAADGRTREVFCLDLDSFPMWLATIDENRVAPEVAPKLVAYQREAARVLRAHFFPARAEAPEYPSARAALGDLIGRAVSEGDWQLVEGLASVARRRSGVAHVGSPIAQKGGTFYPVHEPRGVAQAVATLAARFPAIPPAVEALAEPEVTCAGVCVAAGLKPSMAAQMAAAHALRARGWRRARPMRQGQRRWTYFAPTSAGGLDS